jgi:hypothetical protein
LRRPILLSLPLVIGCGPGDRPRLETEHLTFHGEVDGACEGLGALYEREVDRIEHQLGRELLDPIEVHVGLDEVERRCPEGTSTERSGLTGCVVSPTEVATTMDSLSFQLVDAARVQHGAHGVPFIEVALPYMLGYGRPIQGFVQSAAPERQRGVIVSQLAHGWSEASFVDSGLAVHFLHWVEQDYGSEALRTWLWSDAMLQGTDVVAAFTEATGQTLALAEERWSEDADRDAIFGGLCHGLPAPPLPAGGLSIEATACCDAPGVEQFEPPLVNAGQQCFTVPSDTEVEVELLAGEGDLVLRADGCPHWSDASPLVLRAGEPVTVTLTPCQWKAMVIGPERCSERNGVRYAITPTSR